MVQRHIAPLAALLLVATLAGCSGETSSLTAQTAESCMQCHNGSLRDDYSGPGVENPHPFGGADNLRCTTCHGGNPNGTDVVSSHVPPPPEIGDRAHQDIDAYAYFNRLTLAGIDKLGNYDVAGTTYSPLDWLKFVNPGDLRVTSQGEGCGQCHAQHAESVSASPLATEMGVWSGASFAIGMDNTVPGNAGLHDDTASDMAFRAVDNSGYSGTPSVVGEIASLIEAPVFSVRNANEPDSIFQNPIYDAAALADDQHADGRVVSGSPLANLFVEQVSFTCGDCHLGSAGANNRAGDFRSSGCSACHMPYSLGGRSGSSDPNVNKLEPLDPDDIDDPERPHARTHKIHARARTLANGVEVPGIDDHTCAGCHQGSNRTVMQYWGIRLDQNADVRNHRQYPANPASSTTTHADTRLFDPAVGNNTFNGRNGNQYLLAEDYDDDGRDDTPADVHYEAGLGCIDCHGSVDLHGDVNDPDKPLLSRMEQAVQIRCESCHGTIDEYAEVASGADYDGVTRDLAHDASNHALKHVWKDATGRYWLKSRLTGNVHYIPQTRDTVADTGASHPTSGTPVYSAKASYAMGRVDAVHANGIGPVQDAGTTDGFSHTDRMDCVACHGSWTNTCMGCHLSGEYDNGNNFSNVTGERIVFKQRTADFTYQSPLFFQLGVGPRGQITQFSANTKVFFQWEDRFGALSQRTSFSDRKSAGNSSPYGALSHNAIMAHSVRGKVAPTKEGPRYCVACHMTTESLTNFRPQYDAFRAALEARNYGVLDYALLQQHFGRNTGNQMDSPLFAHMAAGLGTGLFTFDHTGTPVNPLDTFAGRKGANDVAPSTVFNAANIDLDLDRIVEPNGRSNASSNHAWMDPAVGPSLRDGALDPEMAGPLGATLIRLLADPDQGLVLDSWLDANGAPHGGAAAAMGP